MNGPDHYREAERLEKLAADQWGDSQAGDPCPQAIVTAQRAQVHATLALAAAQAETAYAVATRGSEGGIGRDWIEAVQ